MKLRKVSYFLALCEERSFTRAARRCGVAQPSMTRAVQLLEHEIGGRLFERSNSSVCLTKLGILLQPHFEAINSAAETIKRAAAEFSEADTVASAETPVASYTRHSPLSQ